MQLSEGRRVGEPGGKGEGIREKKPPTENSMVTIRGTGEWVETERVKGGRVNGEGRRLDLGW